MLLSSLNNNINGCFIHVHVHVHVHVAQSMPFYYPCKYMWTKQLIALNYKRINDYNNYTNYNNCVIISQPLNYVPAEYIRFLVICRCCLFISVVVLIVVVYLFVVVLIV